MSCQGPSKWTALVWPVCLQPVTGEQRQWSGLPAFLIKGHRRDDLEGIQQGQHGAQANLASDPGSFS